MQRMRTVLYDWHGMTALLPNECCGHHEQAPCQQADETRADRAVSAMWRVPSLA